MIFGIGLSKTGTHSLNAALEILGLRSVHYPSPELMNRGRFVEALAGCNAATDISVGAYFRELDRAFPASAFILTVREMESWLASVEDHRRRREHELENPDCPKAVIRERLYGLRGFDREAFADAAKRHERDVRAYFRDRPRDLLVMDVCGGEGWERLCPFLGLEIPDVPFPQRNARASARAA